MIVETPGRPTKIIAVHLNYYSRASERGAIPKAPSYFLKPPSSLAGDGDPIVRPRGCELLNYEGEVALIIGQRVRRVTPAAGRKAIGWVTAVNDFGIYDFRWADRGSNLLAKGHDGFTPVGPRLVPASELDLDALTLSTRVNGEVVQRDSTANLVFDFGTLVADLSRFITLEPGDMILTGTPANSLPVQPGDVVEVEVEGVGTLRNPIVESGEELEPYGAMPKVDAAVRGAAWGANGSRQLLLSSSTRAALEAVSTATLSVQLAQRGISNAFLSGLRPSRPDLRMLGYAHTLRYVALREDVSAVQSAGGQLNAQKAAIEALSKDEVLVIEARGEAGAGTVGDILATRAMQRGAAGIVTDGAARDAAAISGIPMPTYYLSSHAATLGRLHFPLQSNVPVTCGGVLVMPGDVIIGDADGVVVIPAALAEDVARDAIEQEDREAWALERVQAGESIVGIFPLSQERMAEYEAWRAQRGVTVRAEP